MIHDQPIHDIEKNQKTVLKIEINLKKKCIQAQICFFKNFKGKNT